MIVTIIIESESVFGYKEETDMMTNYRKGNLYEYS